MNLLLLFFCLFFAVSTHVTPYSAGVVPITVHNWHTLNHTQWLVLFHWHYSPTSHHLLSQLSHLAQHLSLLPPSSTPLSTTPSNTPSTTPFTPPSTTLSTTPAIKLGVVDVEQAPELVALFDIDAYPMLKYFANATFTTYHSGSSLPHLLTFLNTTHHYFHHHPRDPHHHPHGMSNESVKWVNSWSWRRFPSHLHDSWLGMTHWDIATFHAVQRLYHLWLDNPIYTSSTWALGVAYIVFNLIS